MAGDPRLDGGNAYATGQVLYALERAGVSVASPAFVRGVGFLLEHQLENGAWPAEHTQTHRPSEFAPTMWAVIGLAGSFGEVIPEIAAPATCAWSSRTATIRREARC